MKKKKVLLLALCLLLVLTVLSLSLEEGHPCQGDGCPICACLHQLMLGLCVLSVFLCWNSLPFVQSVHGCCLPSLWAYALKKVRLND